DDEVDAARLGALGAQADAGAAADDDLAGRHLRPQPVQALVSGEEAHGRPPLSGECGCFLAPRGRQSIARGVNPWREVRVPATAPGPAPRRDRGSARGSDTAPGVHTPGY